jgi:hypothetical protein
MKNVREKFSDKLLSCTQGMLAACKSCAVSATDIMSSAGSSNIVFPIPTIKDNSDQAHVSSNSSLLLPVLGSQSSISSPNANAPKSARSSARLEKKIGSDQIPSGSRPSTQSSPESLLAHSSNIGSTQGSKSSTKALNDSYVINEPSSIDTKANIHSSTSKEILNLLGAHSSNSSSTSLIENITLMTNLPPYLRLKRLSQALNKSLSNLHGNKF